MILDKPLYAIVARVAGARLDREIAWLFPSAGMSHSRHWSRSWCRSPAGIAGGIGIGTAVRCRHDQHAIAVDVNIG